jgi:hypothetical protein
MQGIKARERLLRQPLAENIWAQYGIQIRTSLHAGPARAETTLQGSYGAAGRVPWNPPPRPVLAFGNVHTFSMRSLQNLSPKRHFLPIDVGLAVCLSTRLEQAC